MRAPLCHIIENFYNVFRNQNSEGRWITEPNGHNCHFFIKPVRQILNPQHGLPRLWTAQPGSPASTNMVSSLTFDADCLLAFQLHSCQPSSLLTFQQLCPSLFLLLLLPTHPFTLPAPTFPSQWKNTCLDP